MWIFFRRASLLLGHGTVTLPEVEAATAEFDFLKNLPQREDDWPKELKDEVNAYAAATKEHNGLILRAVVPELLGVSRQRVDQLSKEYGFWTQEFFGRTWYSRCELENFYKLQRTAGGSKPSVLSIAKTMLKDAQKD